MSLHPLNAMNLRWIMKTIRPIIACAPFLLLFLCARVAIAEDCTAKIVSVSGDSEMKLKSGGSEFVPAEENACLQTGDAVRTKAGGKIVLRYATGQEKQLSEPTILTIAPATSVKKLGLTMTSGEIVVKVTKKQSMFTVKTPTAVCGVRGTEFNVAVDEKTGKSDVHVIDGVVSILNDLGEVLAKGGMAATILQNALPETSTFNVGEYMEIINLWQGGITVGKVRDFVKKEIKKRIKQEATKRLLGGFGGF